MGWWSDRGARAGAVLLLLLVAIGLGAPLLAPYDPTMQDRGSYHRPPGLPPGGCGFHWWPWDRNPAGRHLIGFSGCRVYLLGTDGLGRDILSRVLHGARRSVLAAALGVAVTVTFGTIVGTLSGVLGGLWDRILMRLAELLMTLPALYLVLAVRSVFPDTLPPAQSSLILVGSLSVVGWCAVSRLIRAHVLSLRECGFVCSAVAAGASTPRLLFVHILPNALPFILLQVGLTLPYFLLGEAALSYLGLGVQEPEPSLGNMMAAVANNYTAMTTYWWTLAAPGAVLTLAVLGANLWMEGLRRTYLGSGTSPGFAGPAGTG